MNASRCLHSTLAGVLAAAAILAQPAAGADRAASALTVHHPALGWPLLAFTADDAEGGASRSAAYRDGQRALDAGKWREAAATFARVAAEKGADADAALYWQAYALGKDGRSNEALAALRELRSSYPKSSWLDDSQALELELRGPQAPVPNGEGSESEELKLYALSGLLQVDSARSVPVLQKFLAGNASLRLKKQALFVLSQSDSAEAKQALGAVARGRNHPELQREAIEMLGVAGDKESVAALSDIYRESSDAGVKKAVLQAFLVADAEDQVFAIARDDKDADVRRKAIQQLGAMDATRQLRDLYGRETDAEVRRTILEAMGVAGDVEGLSQAARGERDPTLRRAAIQALGVASSPAATAALKQIYAANADAPTRRAVIEGLFVADDAHALIELFRAEKDRELKHDIIEKLSLMDSPEATDLLLKMLEQ